MTNDERRWSMTVRHPSIFRLSRDSCGGEHPRLLGQEWGRAARIDARRWHLGCSPL